jgi:hypothetical protein
MPLSPQPSTVLQATTADAAVTPPKPVTVQQAVNRSYTY